MIYSWYENRFSQLGLERQMYAKKASFTRIKTVQKTMTQLIARLFKTSLIDLHPLVYISLLTFQLFLFTNIRVNKS